MTIGVVPNAADEYHSAADKAKEAERDNAQQTLTEDVAQLKEDVSGLKDKVAENQADSEAADVAGLLEAHNALLAKLKAAGLMEPDAESE